MEEELALERAVAGGVGGGRRAYGQNLEGAVPVQGKNILQHDGVGVLSGALADGGSAVVDPGAVTYGERG